MTSSEFVSAPMSETKKLFIYEVDDNIANKYQYESALSGKWVLFYKKQSMERVWKEVCQLYHEEKLEGIEFLKTSTAKFNDRLKDSDLGMISFICGPRDDLELVQKYGKKLLMSVRSIGPISIDTMLYMACDPATPSGASAKSNYCKILCDLEVPEELISEDYLRLREPVLTTKNDPVGSPRTETEELYLYEYDFETEEKYKYGPSESGKWMLFYENKSMDEMWANACSLYRDGELTGVRTMKVSTAKYNPRQSSDKLGVIIFYCGPSSDEDLMKSYGKGILEKMHRFGPFDRNHMPYKTNTQTRLGTRATGNLCNSIYSLSIPENWRSVYCDVSVWDSNISTDELPSLVLDKPFIFERCQSISSKWPCDPVLMGHWFMVFEEPWLDRAWKRAQNLYRAGKLTGIQSMSVSTAKINKDRQRKTGFINCFCGPKDDVDLVMTYGDNLVKLMSYHDRTGIMNYKYRKETICKVRLADYWHHGTVDRKRSTRTTSNDVGSWRMK